MNWKGYGRQPSWFNPGTIPEFSSKRWGKHRKPHTTLGRHSYRWEYNIKRNLKKWQGLRVWTRSIWRRINSNGQVPQLMFLVRFLTLYRKMPVRYRHTGHERFLQNPYACTAHISPNVWVKWLALLLPMHWGASGSNLGPETRCPDWTISWFSQSLKQNNRIANEIGSRPFPSTFVAISCWIIFF
jgi:hypothetical protein